jgi:hypothetical protein
MQGITNTQVKYISIAVIAALLFLVVIPSYISAANYGNATEKRLDAKLADNENVYAQGTQAVVEIAQVPTMYVQDLKQLITADIQGRYGQNGSQATFQWFQERQLNLDQSMYRAIQQSNLAFRNKFENSQRELLDIRRGYETALGNVWEGFWLARAGYPKVDLKKYDIVTTDKARQTFESKRDTGINLLRPAN